MRTPELRKHLKDVTVFARASPEQKESILATLKDEGNITLMCGDGTNDVGALKQAYIGVALLSVPEQIKKKKNFYFTKKYYSP